MDREVVAPRQAENVGAGTAQGAPRRRGDAIIWKYRVGLIAILELRKFPLFTRLGEIPRRVGTSRPCSEKYKGVATFLASQLFFGVKFGNILRSSKRKFKTLFRR